MESLGILLAAAFGLVASPVYCRIVARIVRLHPFAPAVLWTSAALLTIFMIEIALVLSQGIIGARTLVGSGFFIIHALLVLAVAPAFGNTLLLGWKTLKWPVAAVLSWFVGMTALFYQIDVAETLYGIDGIGGPFAWPF